MDRQEANAGSMLHFTRRMIALRNANPALRHGAMTIDVADDAILAFRREGAGQSMLCAFNFSDTAQNWQPDRSQDWRVVERINGGEGWILPPFGGVVAERVI